MLGRLVTLETYMNAMQAHLVKNQLQAMGIRCVLADEFAVSMTWHLSNAIGGIKVQVAEEDLERAEEVLDALERSHRSDRSQANETEEQGSDTGNDEAETGKPAAEAKPDPDGDDDDEPALNAREQMAERAYRAVLIGLVVLPLQFYATWLLLGVWQEDQLMRPAVRHRLSWAIGLNVPAVIVAFAITAIFLREMIYGT
jgi:hypothetical protein